MFNTKSKILLGSGSPRRKLLLQELGLDFRVLTSHTAEIPLPHLIRGDIAVYLAEEKAEVLINEIKDDEVLVTADTIVCLKNEVLGKPANEHEAFEMIKKLSGQTHQVFTGICIADKKARKSFYVKSDVIFNRVPDNEIKHYIKVYKPFDKAGSYGAQECLPNHIDPCSSEEKKFLKEIGETDLYERTKSKELAERIPLINHIEGSYFNVMGLPIVELLGILKEDDKI